MEQEEFNEILMREILVNRQLLKAIIILLSPNRTNGIQIIEECQDEIYKAFNEIKQKEGNALCDTN